MGDQSCKLKKYKLSVVRHFQSNEFGYIKYVTRQAIYVRYHKGAFA
jgi:hypothetical protein